jgi:hypothetical protein
MSKQYAIYQDPNLKDKPPFKPYRLIIIVLAIMLFISAAAQWYARNVHMPRYCTDSEETLRMVRLVLSEQRPAGNGDRKPYIIATRLTFLVPRKGDEPLDVYLDRLQRHIDQECQ